MKSLNYHCKACLGLGLLLSCTAAQSEVHSYLGGHLRANVDYRDWVDSKNWRVDFESLKLTGNLAWDSGNTFNFDVRHYDNVNINVVRFADFSWRLDDQNTLKLGITKVPFGIQDFLSDSFWFSINYYVGLEDDYDLGVVYEHKKGEHLFKYGYFITDELADATEFGRFSFDVASDAGNTLKEDGQLNFYYEYNPVWFENSKSKIGVSAQLGRVKDSTNNQHHNHYAWSAFYRQPLGQWQTTLQFSHYRYEVDADRVLFSAFDFPFPVSSKANSWVMNLSYRMSEPPSMLDTALFYTELGIVDGSGPGSDESVQWVLGTNFMTGNFVFYLDYIHGQNMWFSGGNGVGVYFPDDPGSTSRINFSTAYHF